MKPTPPRLPVWLLLGWNIVGLAAWGMQINASPEQLANGDAAVAEVWRSMPVWVWGAYTVAVWGGLGGAVALLTRRRVAVALFAISLTGIVAQFGWSFLVSPLLTLKGWSAAIFPAVIFAIGLTGLLYARRQFR